VAPHKALPDLPNIIFPLQILDSKKSAPRSMVKSLQRVFSGGSIFMLVSPLEINDEEDPSADPLIICLDDKRGSPEFVSLLPKKPDFEQLLRRISMGAIKRIFGVEIEIIRHVL
jgi:hypothetical protein